MVLQGGSGVLLDMGCGVGLITLKAVSKGWDVVAVDREPRALDGLRKSLTLSRLNRCDTRLIISDLFRGMPRSYLGHFDLITFNPPYVKGQQGCIPRREDLPLYGGINGIEVVERFLADVFDFLSENGSLLFLGYSNWPVEEWIEESRNHLKVERIRSKEIDGENISIYHIHRNGGWIGELLYSSEDNSTVGEI
jgi:methylase of polypeptide subunit release factors